MSNRYKVLSVNTDNYSIETNLEMYKHEYNIHSINFVPPPSFSAVRISDMGTGSYPSTCIIVLESKNWNFNNDLHETLK